MIFFVFILRETATKTSGLVEHDRFVFSNNTLLRNDIIIIFNPRARALKVGTYSSMGIV